MELTLKNYHTVASFIPTWFPGPLFIPYSGEREAGTVKIKNLGQLGRGCYRPLRESVLIAVPTAIFVTAHEYLVASFFFLVK